MLAQIGALNSITGMDSTSAAKAARITKLNGAPKGAPPQSEADLAAKAAQAPRHNGTAEAVPLQSLSSGGSNIKKPHRRDALWQVERVAQPTGPLLEELDGDDFSSPLEQMTAEE